MDISTSQQLSNDTFIKNICSYNDILEEYILNTEKNNISLIAIKDTYEKHELLNLKIAYNVIKTTTCIVVYIRYINYDSNLTFGYCVLRIPNDYHICFDPNIIYKAIINEMDVFENLVKMYCENDESHYKYSKIIISKLLNFAEKMALFYNMKGIIVQNKNYDVVFYKKKYIPKDNYQCIDYALEKNIKPMSTQPNDCEFIAIIISVISMLTMFSFYLFWFYLFSVHLPK